MASKTILTAFMNFSNDIKRETINEIVQTFESKKLLTDDIKEILESMMNSVKTNKKIKKPPQKRFSGYHLFMKEHRSVVKENNPGIKPQELTTIVSKAWKDVSDKEKKKLNERAMKMKEQYNESTNSIENESITSKVQVESVDDKKKSVKKVEKKTSSTKNKA
jgi:hypothetical protein